MAPLGPMGKAVAKNKAAAPSSDQQDALVAAAARLEDACRDVADCLRALPGVAEQRAAALLLRAAAVSGRLHLKCAIQLLDSAWADDEDGPLCGQPRVVPETPERGSLAGASDDEDPPVNGSASNGDEASSLPNGVTNGSAAEDVRPGTADVLKAGSERLKRENPLSDSDDSLKSPMKKPTKKKRGADLELEDEPAGNPEISSVETEPCEGEPSASNPEISSVETEPCEGEPSASNPEISRVKTEPCDKSELGQVVANIEPVCGPADSEEVIIKTETEVTVDGKPENTFETTEETPAEADPPVRADSPMDGSVTTVASPDGQNELDRRALLLSSGDEDADDPDVGIDEDGDVLGGDENKDGTHDSDRASLAGVKSEAAVCSSGSEEGGVTASSRDSDLPGGRRLRRRAVKAEPSDNGSDSTGSEAGKRKPRRQRSAKKSDNGDSDSARKFRRSRARRRRGDSDRDSSSDRQVERHSRRRRVGPKRSVSNSSASSGSDTAEARRSGRRGRRRRRPRGPSEPSAECSVVLTRLPAEIEREATENGFVKITKGTRRRLSEETMQVRRLANVAALLRTSMGGGGDSSEDTDEDDSGLEAQKKAKGKANRKATKPDKKKKKTLKDMSDGEGGGRPSCDESDGSNKPFTSGLVPMEENEFDREQLLASDSGSEADSETIKDDDSDFAPRGKEKKRDEDKKKKKLRKKAGETQDESNASGDDLKSTKDNKLKKKLELKSEGEIDEENGKEKVVKKEGEATDESEDVENDKNKASDKGRETGKKGNKRNKHGSGDDEDKDENSNGKSDPNASGSETDQSKSKKEKSKQLSAKMRKLLNAKMSATDSSEEDEKMKEKMLSKRAKEAEKAAKEKVNSDKSDADEDGNASDELPALVSLPSSDEEEVVEKKRTPRKKRMRVVDDSDSDFCVIESEEEEEAGPSKKRGRSSSSSISSVSDSSDDFKPPKKTRSRGRLKRIRKMSDDSASSSGDDSVEEKPDSQNTPSKGGRKNIRHIREAEQSTKEASQAESERRKRIEDKQSKYNELFKNSSASDEPEVLDRLVLDFDSETKKSLVSVHKNFVKILKPHQVNGVKFMFDSTVESVARLEDESNQDNAGCILAHCMGLGKTLQVIVLLHTLLVSSSTSDKIACALVVCPKNTVQNWVRELKNWQKKCRVSEVDVVDITFRKDNYERSFELEQWQTEGGVCVLSYDMFKRFSGTGGKKGYVKKQKDRFQKALVDPGPDIVVCDEGHLLKNPRTAAFKSLNQMKCRRRVILTGTPLQNNLREYHTMVEFVKPRLLGSESEFSNRFIRPIENGSAVDAMPRDVKLMKRRSHVLHKLLNSVVQRCDYNVLMPFLPPKLEFTLMVKLSDLQKKLYESYLEKCRGQTTRKVLSDFQALSRVWTHPRSIQMKDEQDDEKEDMKSERAAMERFVADDSSSEEDNSKDANTNDEENGSNGDQGDDSEWWRSCIPDDMHFDDPGLSGKLMLLDQLLIKCENIGDKLLVFSQSLFTLNLIEEHLERLHKEMQRSRNTDKKHPSHVYFGTWKEGYDYFRLDGSTSEERRQSMCDRINKASNERARLMLISTKAGGLGINLVGANRVVIFDASWNPTADSQAIFRVYRFGQVKPSYVYRFIAQGCMEEKIYDRQISKLSLSCRVVDEQQVERHFNQHDAEELYEFEPERQRTTGVIVPKDDLVLMELVSEQSKWVSSVHGHDSLLQNVADEELNADEQRAAWEEYENDRRGIPNVGDIIPLVEGKAIDKGTVIEMIKKDNPTATDNEVLQMIPRAIQTLRAFYFKKQQEELRAREEQYRQALQMQRQAMYSQQARQAASDASTYAQLMELMAAQRRPGAPPAGPSRQQAAVPPPPAGRQRTAHQPGPAYHQQRAGTTMRALAEAAADSRRALDARQAGGSGGGADPAGALNLPNLTVRPVKEKAGQDSTKGGKPTKPPDVVDIA